MWKSTGWLAKNNHVKNETIQNWIKKGYYERYEKTKGGHYRVWVEEPKKTILYARISSRKQITSLERQSELLRDKHPEGEIITDIASGFNQNRKGYKKILEQAISGTPLILVATTSDRITRTGFQLIKWIIELSGGRIELLEEKDNSDQFDTKTLVAFITSFINSHYGKRNANRNKKDKDIPTE